MNTGGASHPDGVAALRDLGEISERGDRARECDEALLAAIAAALRGQPTTPADLPAPPSNDGVVAERWRQTGGALTATTAHTDGSETASVGASAGSSEESRLVARIETPGLGSVCIVIDRSESGMKVVLAMNDLAAVQNANAERASLIQALEAVGLTVASVSVQRIDDGGISFAHVRDAHEERMFGASGGSETTEGKSEGRSRRRLNLVG